MDIKDYYEPEDLPINIDRETNEPYVISPGGYQIYLSELDNPAVNSDNTLSYGGGFND